MRIEDDRVAGRYHADDIAAEGRDGVCTRCDGSDDTKGGELFHGDAMVAAHSVGFEELDTGQILQPQQFVDFVIQTADVSFIQLDAPPLRGVVRRQFFNDVDDRLAASDTFFLKLFIGSLRCFTSF